MSTTMSSSDVNRCERRSYSEAQYKEISREHNINSFKVTVLKRKTIVIREKQSYWYHHLLATSEKLPVDSQYYSGFVKSVLVPTVASIPLPLP